MTFPFYGMKTVEKNFTVNGILNRAVQMGGTPVDITERAEVFFQVAVSSGELDAFDISSIKVKEFIHARIHSGYVKMVDNTEFTEVLGGVI